MTGGTDGRHRAEADRNVASLAAALSLLDCFDSDVALRLKDLHARTGLQKSRILRLTGTLCATGYLTVDAEGGYRLGPRIAALGQLVSDGNHAVLSRIHPLLEQLCVQLGDTCFFSIVRGMHRLAADKVSPANGIVFSVVQGQTRPLHRGATGRVLLAYGPPAVIDRVVASTPELDDAGEAEMRADLQRARNEGYLLSVGQLTSHAFALAVPVLGEAAELIGALTIAGPESKVSPAGALALARRMNLALAQAGFTTSSV